MHKRMLTLAVITTLLAGFYLSPAEANSEKIQRILQITGLPAERSGVIGGKPVTLKARLDRDMLVYGLPTDVPDNDWKTEADGVTTSWQEANGIDLGHPGGQEPRYLGLTPDGDPLASDYFPDDAPNHVAPARRDMIEHPWDRGLCSYRNSNTISGYSWGAIVKTLLNYHDRVGYPGPGNGFAGNPAFRGNFNKDTLKDYFLVMAEPQPGLAGAVRHWHYRHDLGGIWYDPIFIRWDVLPNFIMESIDPGTDKARPGETYTGKAVLNAVPDASFLSDPVTGQLFESLGLEKKLSQDYMVPFGIAINGQLVPVKDFQPLEGLNNVFQYQVLDGTVENRMEVPFEWTAPAGGGKISLGAAVNTVLQVLPSEAWGYMEWSEITSIDNAKTVEVVLEGQYDIKVEILPDENVFTAVDEGFATVGYNVRLTRKDDIPGDIEVSLTVTDLDGQYPERFTLGREPRTIPYIFEGVPGSYTIEAEAWPEGSDDAYPEDNRDVVTVTVAKEVMKTDSKIHVELLN